jgi:hypothetical protein
MRQDELPSQRPPAPLETGPHPTPVAHANEADEGKEADGLDHTKVDWAEVGPQEVGEAQ